LIKTFTPSGLKFGTAGRVEAAFSVFGNVDGDGDIVMPGAIPDGAEIAISAFNHASWQPGILPIGKGRVRTTPDAAIVEADFFDTAAARDTLTVLKGLDSMSRWSFGFDILDFSDVTSQGRRVRLLTKLRVHEASPVLRPSNEMTRTLSVSMAGDEDPAEAEARAQASFVRLGFERAMAAEAAGIRDELSGAA
jgi:hypothetical protein